MMMNGEIPTMVFLIISISFTFLAYLQFKKFGKTIETIFLSILAILFLFSYLALIIIG